ncbi:MAG: V-type ATP synthase subunit I [bacterium]
MPVVSMKKVALFGHQKIQESLLSELQKQGLIELTKMDQLESAPQSEPEFELSLAELENAINLLEKICGKKKGFIESFAPYKEPLAESSLQRTAQEFDWQKIVAQLKELESRLANLKNLTHSLQAEMAALSPWQSINIILDPINCSEKICLTAGSCKLKDFEALKQGLEENFPAHKIETIETNNNQIYFLLFSPASISAKCLNFLSKTSFEKSLLPLANRTPAEELANLTRLLKENHDDQTKITKEIMAFYRYSPSLKLTYDYLSQQALKEKAKEKIALTSKTFLLAGWIAAEKVGHLKKRLGEVSPLLELREIEPSEGEVAPTIIKNVSVFYPFELVTRIFGLPSQNEIDPTGPLAFFYLLFFAMCLSDVGYGILLAIVSFYFLKKLTLTEGGTKLLLLLFWGGIATIFVGIMTGSYFSMDLNQLPPLLKKLQVIDPIKNPLNVLLFSIGLGVIQNITGVALAMYWKLKDRDYLAAFLDSGLWIYFLLSLVAYGATASLGSPLAVLFGRFAMVGAALLVLTQGRNEKGIFKKFIFGLLSLYRTTGYLGDTLSYSRLLALMMTTSIIGMVINIIASMTTGIPIIGYFVMALVLVIGHIFNLVVSVLGAFIHSARLQLVEFFGKFFEGNGKEFKPFSYQTKYVIIK